MTNKYLKTRETYGRIEQYIDVGLFAADLAKGLGADLEPLDPDKMYDDYRTLVVMPNLGVTVYSNRYDCKGKVFVSATVLNVPAADRPYMDGKGTYKMPSAKVSAERPMAVIARDVKRRVIDAATVPLVNTLDYVAKRREQRSDLASVVAELAAKVPELNPANNGASGDGYSQQLYWSGVGNTYLAARVYATGDVGIDRIGNVPLAAFVEIAGVLRKYASAKVAT